MKLIRTLVPIVLAAGLTACDKIPALKGDPGPPGPPGATGEAGPPGHPHVGKQSTCCRVRKIRVALRRTAPSASAATIGARETMQVPQRLAA
jgi:hypothetical protein